MKLLEKLSRVIRRKLNKLRSKLNEQKWIIKVFAIIGAATILTIAILIFKSQIVFFYKHATRDQTKIVITNRISQEINEIQEEKPKEEANHQEEKEAPQNAIFNARVTAYSELDSCHYPKIVNGERKCLNSIGKIARVGTGACPVRFKGKSVEIEGYGKMICEDVTAEWVQKDFSHETFDIFFGYGKESHSKAKKFGAKQLKVKIL